MWGIIFSQLVNIRYNCSTPIPCHVDRDDTVPLSTDFTVAYPAQYSLMTLLLLIVCADSNGHFLQI